MAIPYDKSTYNVVGTPGNKDQNATQILTGKWDFGADKCFPDKLHARILGSAHAHAQIVSIDTSAAEALPGVEAVTTYLDCPTWSENLFFVGQEVAAVAATDPYIAARALRLIEVVYDVRPHITDYEEAAESGSTLSGVLPDTNVRRMTEIIRGDVDTAWAGSEVQLELPRATQLTISTARLNPMPVSAGGLVTNSGS